MNISNLTKADLITPALLLDMDAFEFNIAKMASHTKTVGINLRPHGKSHKCPEIARRQIKAGAIGLCVATIREAEAMVSAGINGLLITSELVGKPKIKRLIELAQKSPDIISVVDNIDNARQLSDAASGAKITLNILIDIDPGTRRTGVSPGIEAIALAEKIIKLPNLNLNGIHGYSGTSAHINGFDARSEHSINAMTPVIETYDELKKKGMPMEILSGGSTGTYNIDPYMDGITELQAGSYVFMDVEYRSIGSKTDKIYDDFLPSLTVLTTVISKNHSDISTIDAGIKAFSTDSIDHQPEIKDITGVTLSYGGDEHGILKLDNPSHDIKLGNQLEFIVPHCDPNVNLFDRIYCVRGNDVVDVWPTISRYGN